MNSSTFTQKRLDQHDTVNFKDKLIKMLETQDLEKINQIQRRNVRAQLLAARQQEQARNHVEVALATPTEAELEADLQNLEKSPAATQTLDDDYYQADMKHKQALRSKLPPRWLIVAIFASSSMLLPFCIDMYLSAFPTMAADFGVEVNRIELSLSMYFIGIALGQILWGPLSDSWGRKWIASAAYTALAISSAIITQVYDLNVFLTLRFVQGFFSAAILIASTSILRDIYDTREFVAINGLINIIFFVAPFLAPLVGSYIVLFSNWHMIFWFIGFMALLSTVLFTWTIPETINPLFKRKLDLGNTLRQMGSIATDGASLWLILLMSVASCMTFTYVTMSSGVFQTFYHVSPTIFPYLFMINIIGASVFNIVNTRLVKKFPPQKLLYFGVIGSLGAGIFSMATSFMDLGLPVIVFGCMLTQSVSPLIFLNAIAVYLEMHYKHSGTASSLVNLMRWIMPGMVTILAQQVDPHRGYTMLFMMGLFSSLLFVCFMCYNFYYNKKYKHPQAAA